jgi:hypothetical protein
LWQDAAALLNKTIFHPGEISSKYSNYIKDKILAYTVTIIKAGVKDKRIKENIWREKRGVKGLLFF